MKKLLAILCIPITVLLGNMEVSESAEPIDGVCLPKTKHYHYPIAGKCSASYKKGDYETALREFRPLAEQGNAAAQGNLGLMYKHGAGVPKDDKAAVKWFKLAAEDGHSDAKLIIAAENGDKNAAFRLGGIYSGTLGGGDFPEDRGMARRYWKIAAEQGHSGAQRIMNISVPWWKPWKLYGWWRFW